MMGVKLNQEICQPGGGILAAPNPNAIIAAFVPTGAVQNLFGSLVQQPRFYCNTGLALALVVTDAGAAITSAQVQVAGLDMHGRALYEVRSTNVAGSASYPLVKPFYTISAITGTGVDFSGAMTMALGTIGVVGLPSVITAQDDVLVARIDAVEETIAAVISVANNTYTPSAPPDAAARFFLNIKD